VDRKSSKAPDPVIQKQDDQAPPEDTFALLRRVRQGDTHALDRLLQRYLPRLRRWATGRLPQRARSDQDTDDLVQLTLIRAFHRLQGFEPRHEGALQAYLRQALLNNIRNQAQRVRDRPPETALTGSEEDPQPSPLEQAVGRENAERYEAAFNRLRPEDRQAIVLRLEMGFSYQETAAALKKSSADAARMAVTRALSRLAREMRE
jgi:RNA polymerase sigma-70 factor (ECF subfamily)